MSSRLATTATFVAGVAIGAAMVYLAPPAQPVATPGGHAGLQGMNSPPAGVQVDPDGEAIPAADQALGPPPVPGLAPADGAQGPPTAVEAEEGMAPDPSMALGEEARPRDWLEQHLEDAREFWLQQADTWEEEANPEWQEAIAEARALAETVPAKGDLAPPLPEVVFLLSDELGLYERARDQGLDVSEIEVELDGLFEGRR